MDSRNEVEVSGQLTIGTVSPPTAKVALLAIPLCLSIKPILTMTQHR